MSRAVSAATIRSLMPVYEDNYRLMMQWMPALRGIRLPVSLLSTSMPLIHVSVLECTPYTSTVFIRHGFGLREHRLLRDIGFRFRIYHDARLLEVLAYQGRSRFAPFHPWPNPDMLDPFEKRQVNLFIGEWLRCRLRLGQRLEAPAAVLHVTDLKVEN